ncbi:hypothetical protein [Bacillus sp. FJAT-27251]|nr:hypothetical protein [Bacillus sp. FJAT-27251]
MDIYMKNGFFFMNRQLFYTDCYYIYTVWEDIDIIHPDIYIS